MGVVKQSRTKLTSYYLPTLVMSLDSGRDPNKILILLRQRRICSIASVVSVALTIAAQRPRRPIIILDLRHQGGDLRTAVAEEGQHLACVPEALCLGCASGRVGSTETIARRRADDRVQQQVGRRRRGEAPAELACEVCTCVHALSGRRGLQLMEERRECAYSLDTSA